MIRAPWHSFRDFAVMRLDNKDDATVRGYNLLAHRPGQSLSELHAQLHNELQRGVFDRGQVLTLLVEWWNWYRITQGYIRSWPTREKKAPTEGQGLSGASLG